MDKAPPSRAILVVEDEVFIRLVAVEVLADCGLPIYEADSAAEALELIAAHPDIALLFTDINLPGAMDGLALAASVHADQPGIALIVTSGGQYLHDGQVPDDGVFLPKPYRAADLMALVTRQLAR